LTIATVVLGEKLL